MAKLNRESKLREKRFEKQARKEARKLSAATDASEPVYWPAAEHAGATPAPDTADDQGA
jgi:hypothetical protein